MKKDELLKAVKDFIQKNPGKILLGTEPILRMEDCEDGEIDNCTPVLEEREIVAAEAALQEQDETENEVGTAGQGSAGMDVAHDETNAANKSCSIIECDDASSEDLLLWCNICELWFCKDLHGRHNSHSAQTIFKEGRIPKKPVGEDADVIVGKENEVAEEVAAQGKETKNDDDLVALADTIDFSVSTVNSTTTGKNVVEMTSWM